MHQPNATFKLTKVSFTLDVFSFFSCAPVQLFRRQNVFEPWYLDIAHVVKDSSMTDLPAPLQSLVSVYTSVLLSVCFYPTMNSCMFSQIGYFYFWCVYLIYWMSTLFFTCSVVFVWQSVPSCWNKSHITSHV